MSIEYLIEDKPLGTAGSLKMLENNVKDPFLVINGDVLTHFNPKQLLMFHTDHNAKGTLCVREHLTKIPYGVVKTKGIELQDFEEKPSYNHLVNAGVYIIDPSLLSFIEKEQYTDMPNLLKKAQSSGNKVVVCPIHEYWLDVGRPETLQEAYDTWGNK